jgi:hypothetical protein
VRIGQAKLEHAATLGQMTACSETAARGCILLAVRAAVCDFAQTKVLHLPARSRLVEAGVSLSLERNVALGALVFAVLRR